MEPITTTALAVGAWEIIGKPFAEQAREYYSKKVLDGLPELLKRFKPLTKNEQKTIEEVIVEMPEEERKDEEKFKQHINNSLIIKDGRIIHAKNYIENFHNYGTTYFS